MNDHERMAKSKTRPSREPSKQISLFIPLSEWKVLRQEASRLKVPMTELCRQWMKPQVQRVLREQQEK